MRRLAVSIGIFVVLSIKTCSGNDSSSVEESSSFIAAGNRTMVDCTSGELTKPGRARKYETTADYIRKQGYKAEEHLVVTKDRYLLTIHRIPGPPGSQPVFLQHGIIMSSMDWVLPGKGKSLALILADRGYDVWMGNSRGNTYSRCHLRYTTANFSFWNFSWHEMGVHDLPAEIDYVVRTTGRNITYIGYSMGTTMFFVMASERPRTAAKVNAMLGLGPVAYTNRLRSPLMYVARLAHFTKLYGKVMGTYEVLSRGSILRKTTNYVCNLFSLSKRVCVYSILALVGFNTPQFNYTILPQMLSHTPAGASMKTFNHYFQQYLSGGFHMYDHGKRSNVRLYNSTEPPSYNLSRIQVPVGLFWSENDYFVHPKDVKTLYEQLPNKLISYKIDDPTWNHIDHLYGFGVVEKVYAKVLAVLEDFR